MLSEFKKYAVYSLYIMVMITVATFHCIPSKGEHTGAYPCAL